MQRSLTLQKLLCWSGFISLQVACQIKLSVLVLDSWKDACNEDLSIYLDAGLHANLGVSTHVVDTSYYACFRQRYGIRRGCPHVFGFFLSRTT